MPVPDASICLFGTPGAERNLGVGALRDATVATILAARPEAHITVFDDGWGVREKAVAGGRAVVRLCGARDSRRLHRPESFTQMRASIAVGGFGNAGARIVRDTCAVLDVSGGDSFSDLYGPGRFRTVAWPKRLALAAHRPLVLLPQTYGPFADPALREQAVRLLRGAAQVWARDARSKQIADELLGADTCRKGVDVAFGLPPTELTGQALDAWSNWLDAGSEPVAGVNINGLLVNQVDAARRYGVTPHHGEEMAQVARTILDSSDWRIVIVPHVLGHAQAVDADVEVCRGLARELRDAYGARRVWLADSHRTAGEAKSVIARCSWFTGARMHATIAALSSGVPTGGVAYSDKMAPVFAELGQTTTVDARTAGSEAIVARLLELWRDHETARRSLAAGLPGVLGQCSEQMNAILEAARDGVGP